MEKVEFYLARWQKAGLIDESLAGSIRQYEAEQGKPAGRQWQVVVALILGSILLGAGVLLFVAAHWDRVSPAVRTMLVLSLLIFFHGLGLLVQEKFPALARAMHALGTVAAGAAIALLGQIFHMQEHWPAAVLLWALCAGAGWFLLRDQFQQTLTLLLVPAWILSEWVERASYYRGGSVYCARILAVIGVVYLVAFLRSERRITFGILFSAGALLLPIAVSLLQESWIDGAYPLRAAFLPASLRGIVWLIQLAAIGVGFFAERQSLVPSLATVAVSWLLPWAQTVRVHDFRTGTWTSRDPSLLAYLMVAGLSVLFVWWGMRMAAKALVNYGVVGFALTVVWFYFSSVMDKLGRSLGLITLGVLFLAGGWLLERMRRRLVSTIAGGVA